MASAADKYTAKTFTQLERQISKMYREARSDIKDKMNEFNKRHRAKEKELQRKLKDGLITQEQFDNWKIGQVFVGKQWQQKLDSINKVIANVMQEASNLTHDRAIDVFAENANHTAFEIEKDFKGSVNFGLYDSTTVSRLIREEPELIPRRVVKGQKLEAWETQKVANAISQGIIQGESIDQIASRIARDTCLAANNNSVLYARTAMTGAQNAGRMERLHEAKGMGINVRKRWVATLDSRTRDSHQHMDGVTVDVDEKFVTPLGSKMDYPGDFAGDVKQADVWNCRCTLVYIYPDFEQNFERAAYLPDDEHGHKQWEIVGDITYDQWKAMKMSGTASAVAPVTPVPPPEDEAVKQRRERIDKIMNSGTTSPMTEEQKTEFKQILDGMEDKYLELYERMVPFHNDSDYLNGGGWYSPGKQRVEMNLNSTGWEKSVGRSNTAAWKVKFHEELHQLDHILGISKGLGLNNSLTGCVDDWPFGKATEPGIKLMNAIHKDIINYFNKAIDKYVDDIRKVNPGFKLKHIEDLSKPISRDVRNAVFNLLSSDVVDTGNPAKARALLCPFTDAIGLATGNRVSPYSEGYWGHAPSYNKERKNNGATSECFAEIGSYIMRNDKEALDFLSEYMPDSIKAYKSFFDEIIDFTRNNPIHY